MLAGILPRACVPSNLSEVALLGSLNDPAGGSRLKARTAGRFRGTRTQNAENGQKKKKRVYLSYVTPTA